MIVFILFSLLLLWGWSVSLLIIRPVDNFLRLALAFAFGALGLTLQLFIIVFIFNQPLNWFFLALISIELFIFISLAVKRGLIRFVRPSLKVNIVDILLTAFIFWQFFIVAAGASTMPVVAYDSIAIWSWKSKILVDNFDGFVDADSELYWKKQGHSNYPPHLPLFAYWLNFAQGDWNEESDIMVNIIPAAYFFATSALLFGAVRRESGTRIALLMVFLLSSMPLLAYHGWNNYADLPLAFWALLAAIGLKYSLEGAAEWTLVPVIAACGALFTKNEGVFWLISMLSILAFYTVKAGQSKNFMKQVLIFLALSGPWLLFMMANRLGFSNTGPGLGLHSEIFNKIYSHLFVDFSWNIWWFIFFALVLLFFQKIKSVPVLGVFIYLCLGAMQIVAVFLLTPAYRYLLDGTAFSRTMMSVTVVSVYFTALLLSEKYEKNFDNCARIQ